jgi:4-hydroxy-tetrahydrodipicolinate synthase
MSATDLQWYSGDDALNLAHLTQGAMGIVSVVGHLASRQYAEMIAAVVSGNLSRAIEIHRQLIPAVNAIMHLTQGPIAVKAALHDRGVIASDTLRLPLISATDDQLVQVRAGLEKSGLS